MNTEDEEIRGSDFRKSWPNALSRAMREAGEIAEAMDGQRDELKQVSAKLSSPGSRRPS